jgi:hypothetical protein
VGPWFLTEWHLHEQGATIVPAPSKERQLKIVKGSIVYYLRTINRDYRQVLVSFVMKWMPKYQTWLKDDECIVGNRDYKTSPVLRFSCLNNTIEIVELLKKTTIWCRHVLFHAFSSNFLPYFRNLKWWQTASCLLVVWCVFSWRQLKCLTGSSLWHVCHSFYTMRKCEVYISVVWGLICLDPQDISAELMVGRLVGPWDAAMVGYHTWIFAHIQYVCSKSRSGCCPWVPFTASRICALGNMSTSDLCHVN